MKLDLEQEKYQTVMQSSRKVAEEIFLSEPIATAESIFAVHGFLPSDLDGDKRAAVLECLHAGAEVTRTIFGSSFSLDTYLTVLGDLFPALFDEDENDEEVSVEAALEVAREAVEQLFAAIATELKKVSAAQKKAAKGGG